MKHVTASVVLALAVVAGTLGGSGGVALAQTSQEQIETAIDALKNDITVAPENRCAPYDPKEWRYDSLELKDALIEARRGEIRSYYTGETFTSPDEVDLDHLVALSEAHDSGACAWSSQKKKDFANDINNHQLARPRLNREEKQGKDWAEWQPPPKSLNLSYWCSPAIWIVDTKWRYALTVDQAEYDALAETLAYCLDFYAKPAAEWD